MKRLRMAEQWNSYARQVLPLDAHRTQKIETRRAFYAGAQAIFHGIIVGLSEGEEITGEDLKQMSDLSDELDQFCADVKAGKA